MESYDFDKGTGVSTERLKRLYLHILDNCEVNCVDVSSQIALKVAVSPTSFELTLRGDCAVAIVEVDGYTWSTPSGAGAYSDHCVKQRFEENGRWQVTGLPPLPCDGTRGSYSTPVTFWPRPDGGWGAEIGIVELLSGSDWAVRANQMETLRLDLERLNGTQGESSLSPAQLQVKRMQERMADRRRRSEKPKESEPAEGDAAWVCELCRRVNQAVQPEVCAMCQQPKQAAAVGSTAAGKDCLPVDEGPAARPVWRTMQNEKAGENRPTAPPRPLPGAFVSPLRLGA